tara:strand:+ start:57031 stop:58431 length:1401 start_codon:yes stop_codon:yes gene_type:complete
MNKILYNNVLLSILILSDYISGAIAFNFSFNDQNLYDFTSDLYVHPVAIVFIVQICWSIIFFFANLYDTRATLSRFDEILRLIPIIYSILFLYITMHVFGIIKFHSDYRNILTYGLVFSTLLIINRFIIHSVQKYLLKLKIGLNNAIILGINRRSSEVFDSLQNQSYHGLKVKGFVQAEDDSSSYDFSSQNIKKIGHESELGQIIKSEKISDVIIALDQPKPERIMSAIVNMNGAPISIKILPDMYEVVTGLARTTQLVGVPLIDINMNIDTFYTRVLKRVFDLLIASIGILLCIPIWLIIGFFIKIDSYGPIFYFQSRSGKEGKLFNIIKFRSMITNAESDTGPIWSNSEDIRITRTGKILRRLHLDETPQLINILKGNMSIVGPRPERPFFVKKLKETYPFYSRRLKIRPGVTGWAQINQPFDTNIKDVHQKLKYDFYYIENISLRLDFHILFRTIWVILKGHK